HSTVPFAQASSTCRPGTISPAAKESMVNFPSLISPTNFATVGAAPHRPSMLLGKLEASRHLTVGCCAIAGEATTTALDAAARRAKLRRETDMLILPDAAVRRTYVPDGSCFWRGCRRRSRKQDSRIQ